MEIDCVDFVNSFHDCQTHANLKHVPPSEVYSMNSHSSFLVWGIDMIGRIAPKASNGHKYIIVAINYFTKWVEVALYSILKAKHVARFVENNIICRFGDCKRSSPTMVLTSRERSEGSGNCTTLSIKSLHHTDRRLMGP